MRKLVFAVAAAALAGAGCNALPYAAVVNGTRISQSSFNSQLQQLSNDAQFQALVSAQGGKIAGQGTQTFDSGFVAGFLTQRVNQELIHQRASQLRITVTQNDLALAQADVTGGSQQGTAQLATLPSFYRDQVVRTRAEEIALVSRLTGLDVSLPVVQAYYQAHLDQFLLSCVSVIQVPTSAQAASLRQMIEGGASFADVARSQSSDSQSAQNGGSLGCVPKGTFVSALDQAVNGLGVGAVSQPVQVQGSWVLVQVTSRQVEQLSAATAQIRAQLLAPHTTQIKAVLDRLSRRADVVVNPQYCQRWSASGCAAPKPPPASVLSGATPG